jgi:hypothetical protein
MSAPVTQDSILEMIKKEMQKMQKMQQGDPSFQSFPSAVSNREDSAMSGRFNNGPAGLKNDRACDDVTSETPRTRVAVTPRTRVADQTADQTADKTADKTGTNECRLVNTVARAGGWKNLNKAPNRDIVVSVFEFAYKGDLDEANDALNATALGRIPVVSKHDRTWPALFQELGIMPTYKPENGKERVLDDLDSKDKWIQCFLVNLSTLLKRLDMNLIKALVVDGMVFDHAVAALPHNRAMTHELIIAQCAAEKPALVEPFKRALEKRLRRMSDGDSTGKNNYADGTVRLTVSSKTHGTFELLHGHLENVLRGMKGVIMLESASLTAPQMQKHILSTLY